MNSTTPSQKGPDFESKVYEVLHSLECAHDSVEIAVHPRLRLYDGQEVIPDFHLQVDLHFAIANFLIECQNRKRSTPEILHKIKYIKGLSRRNVFMFVYASRIPDATRSALDADGIPHMCFEEFTTFADRLNKVIQNIKHLPRPMHEYEAVDFCI